MSPGQSITRQLIFFGGTIAIFSLILASIGFGFFRLHNSNLETVGRLEAITNLIAYNVTAPLLFDDTKEQTKTLEALKMDPYVSRARIYGKDGQELVSLINSGKEGTVKVTQLVLYEGKSIGRVEIEARYRPFFPFFIKTLQISLLIFGVILPFAYFISRPLHQKISKAVEQLVVATEALNKSNQELEHSNKELEAFSYSVSHDLRAPLRHIDGFTDLLRKGSASKLDASGLRQLGIISDSVKQMGMLIDDLLLFSRMGRVEMQRTTLDIKNLVKEAIENLAQDMEGRKVSWKIGSFPEVHGDPAMLKQVFINLLGNALKYSRNKPVAQIEVDCEEKKDENVFFVKDNGAGFDMKYADKLFGVFQRLHSAEEFEGTGIGLANVQRIVQRHGGKVWAEGAVDGGAIFYFSLPK